METIKNIRKNIKKIKGIKSAVKKINNDYFNINVKWPPRAF